MSNSGRRATDEWVGKTPDTKIPDRVKLRVFERYGGVCHFSGRKITASDKWDVDHVIALVNGGTNSESNLAPILRDKHKEKTAADVAEKSKTYRRRKSALGLKPKSGFATNRAGKYKRKIDGTIIRR